MKSALFAVWIAAFGFAGPATAVRVENAGPPNQESVRQASPPSLQAADDKSSLRQGLITGVSEKRDQVEINGSWFKVVEGKTRVFRQGRAVKSGDELAKGLQVKFNLAPGSSDTTTLGVVYVP